MAPRRRGAGIAGLLLLALVSAVLGGCGNALKDENAALMQENAELRDRNMQLEGSIGSIDSQRASLEGEIASLRSQLSAAQAAARATPAQPQQGGTGFEGIAGVGSIRGGQGEVILDIAGDVLFDSGSARLKDTAKRSLDRIAEVARSRYGGRMIRVEGYTDSDPIRKSQWKTNERLSAERAMAVEEYLVSKGISGDMIYSAAFGPARPKSTKRESRRVEIVILQSGS